MKIIILNLVFLWLCSCLNNNVDKGDSEEVHKQIIFSDSLIKLKNTIGYKDYSFHFFFDKINEPDLINAVGGLNPLINKQKLSFSKNATHHTTYLFDFGKQELQKDEIGSNVYVDDIAIQKIYIYENDTLTFIHIIGWGGCNSCKEYEAFFSLNGKMLVEFTFGMTIKSIPSKEYQLYSNLIKDNRVDLVNSLNIQY